MKKNLIIIIGLAIFLQNLSLAEEYKIITSDSVVLHVTVKGKGAPCLYIHGGPGSGSYWLEKLMGDSLEKHFTMIYLDQRGVGRSTSPANNDYSIDRMIKDFEEIRKELRLNKWLTMGHSFAGILQTAYSVQEPNKILGHMMINCTLDMKWSYENSWCPMACGFLDLKDTRYFYDENILLYTRWDSLISTLNQNDLMWKMGFENKESMDILNSTYGEIPNWNGDFGNIAMTLDEYQSDYTSISNSINVPVLFFYGTKDYMIGNMFEKVKFKNVILWECDGNHFPFIENKESLMDAIISYKTNNNF